MITDLGLTVPPSSSPKASACEPYREAIEIGLSRGRNAKAIWQDLVTEHGFRGSYQSVQRFVRKQQVTLGPQTRVGIHTAPGEEAQVDYGTGPMVRDPQSGKYRRTRLFVIAQNGAFELQDRCSKSHAYFQKALRPDLHDSKK